MYFFSHWFERLFLVNGDCYISGEDFVIYCETKYKICSLFYCLFFIFFIKTDLMIANSKRKVETKWINKYCFEIIIKGECIKNGK